MLFLWVFRFKQKMDKFIVITVSLLLIGFPFALADDPVVINNVTQPVPNVTEIDVPTTPKGTTSPPDVTTNTPVASSTTETPVPSPKSTATPPTSTVDPKTSQKPSSSEKPATTTATPQHERKFDGPSFVGGIILALGLVAIGFVAFKFYQARTEMNYHTL